MEGKKEAQKRGMLRRNNQISSCAMCAVNKLNIFAAACSCVCGLTCSHLALRFPPAESKLWPSNPAQKL